MSIRSGRLIRVLALGVLFACLPGVVGCGRKGGDGAESEGQKLSVAEKVFEDGEKNAGLVTKACKKVFRDCEFEGSSKSDDGVSLGFTAVLEPGTAARLSVEPKVDVYVAVTKHGSPREAKEAKKDSKADACFVREAVPGKPLTVTFSCGGKSERACCDPDIKGFFDAMSIDLTLM